MLNSIDIIKVDNILTLLCYNVNCKYNRKYTYTVARHEEKKRENIER